jgi:hypothetical protein
MTLFVVVPANEFDAAKKWQRAVSPSPTRKPRGVGPVSRPLASSAEHKDRVVTAFYDGEVNYWAPERAQIDGAIRRAFDA